MVGISRSNVICFNLNWPPRFSGIYGDYENWASVPLGPQGRGMQLTNGEADTGLFPIFEVATWIGRTGTACCNPRSEHVEMEPLGSASWQLQNLGKQFFSLVQNLHEHDLKFGKSVKE